VEKLKRVGVVVLNFKGFDDTVQCIESILEQKYREDFDLFVVDNDSRDNSYEKLLVKYDLTSSSVEGFSKISKAASGKIRNRGKIFIVSTKFNGGYAYGNNAGIEFAQSKSRYDYFLLCNNDLVLSPDSLGLLVRDLEEYSETNRVGLIGAKLNYWHDPTMIQAIAGSYQPYTGRCKHILSPEKCELSFEKQQEEFDYPIGACLLIKSNLIEEVGLLSEDYFLYYEELDYIKRAAIKGFSFGISSSSLILHKEGASIGSSSSSYKKVSILSDYHLLKSRLIFTRKFYPFYLPIVLGIHFFNILSRVIRNEYLKSFNAFKALGRLFK